MTLDSCLLLRCWLCREAPVWSLFCLPPHLLVLHRPCDRQVVFLLRGSPLPLLSLSRLSLTQWGGLCPACVQLHLPNGLGHPLQPQSRSPVRRTPALLPATFCPEGKLPDRRSSIALISSWELAIYNTGIILPQKWVLSHLFILIPSVQAVSSSLLLALLWTGRPRPCPPISPHHLQVLFPTQLFRVTLAHQHLLPTGNRLHFSPGLCGPRGLSSACFHGVPFVLLPACHLTSAPKPPPRCPSHPNAFSSCVSCLFPTIAPLLRRG